MENNWINRIVFDEKSMNSSSNSNYFWSAPVAEPELVCMYCGFKGTSYLMNPHKNEHLINFIVSKGWYTKVEESYLEKDLHSQKFKVSIIQYNKETHYVKHIGFLFITNGRFERYHDTFLKRYHLDKDFENFIIAEKLYELGKESYDPYAPQSYPTDDRSWPTQLIEFLERTKCPI